MWFIACTLFNDIVLWLSSRLCIYRTIIEYLYINYVIIIIICRLARSRMSHHPSYLMIIIVSWIMVIIMIIIILPLPWIRILVETFSIPMWFRPANCTNSISLRCSEQQRWFDAIRINSCSHIVSIFFCPFGFFCAIEGSNTKKSGESQRNKMQLFAIRWGSHKPSDSYRQNMNNTRNLAVPSGHIYAIWILPHCNIASCECYNTDPYIELWFDWVYILVLVPSLLLSYRIHGYALFINNNNYISLYRWSPLSVMWETKWLENKRKRRKNMIFMAW